ncbi:MAG: hypothetical protein H0U44_01450 [Flavisolibacter sp.]|jgi:hypothetical protein|nr:hypothetical protein [Flavisolibacter sp.]
MKKFMLRAPFYFIALFISISSCKKDNTDPVINPDQDEQVVHTQDQATVSNDLDALSNDLNVAIESNFSFSGRFQQTNSICGATAVSDTTGNTKTITITYNGNNCANTHHRSGTIVLSMPSGVRWKNPGAVLTVNYNNLKITRLVDNKWIKINGTHTHTNVTGGLIVNLATLNEIIHTISSNNMTIAFADSTQRSWNVARKRIYNYNNGIVIRTTGTHTINNHTGVAEWGTDRFGHPFLTKISHPLTIRQDCNFRLTSGQVKHYRPVGEAVVTFGLNSSGQPTSCPGAAPFYYKVEWTGPNGITHSVIHPY